MTAIPRPALLLGLAGLLPFLWGAATVLAPELAALSPAARFSGQPLLVSYGTVILCFMSGVLWGFAANGSDAGRWRGYALSVVPALWAFFTVTEGSAAISALMVGFVAVLACDAQFAAWRLVPGWWIRLRVVLTTVVLACLLAGFHG